MQETYRAVRISNEGDSKHIWMYGLGNVTEKGFDTETVVFGNDPEYYRAVSTEFYKVKRIYPKKRCTFFQACSNEEADFVSIRDWQGRQGLYKVDHVEGNRYITPEMIKLWDNHLTGYHALEHLEESGEFFSDGKPKYRKTLIEIKNKFTPLKIVKTVIFN